MADLTGKTIANRYRVDSLVGRGGMGDVYEVWDNQRAVFLAMKVLHADLAEDRVFLRRFAREAETLSTLQHPHIIRFYGLEQYQGMTFMLMDYVEGTTLRKQIFDEHAPFSLQRILRIIHPVCSALYYAHQMGRVHCDIKPANIMVKSNGEVLVADFGIARMLESSTTITLVGAGTPAYMAPEQALGKKPVPQTDIYSLGIVIYEMLAGGERPFTGERTTIDGSTSEKVRWEQIKLRPPSPREYNPAISRDLEKVVLKCLEKDPAQRYTSALELLKAVELATSTRPQAEQLESEIVRSKHLVARAAEEDKAKEEVDRLVAQKAEEERLARDKLEAEQRAKAERQAKIKAERLAVQKAEEERIALAQANAERKAKAERIALAKAKAERKAKEKAAEEKTRRMVIGSALFFVGVILLVGLLFLLGQNITPGAPARSSQGNLYFTSNHDGTTQIYILNTKGQVSRIMRTDWQGNSWSPAPDGHGNLYFTSNHDGTTQIYILNAKGQVSRVMRTDWQGSSWLETIDAQNLGH